MSSIDTNTDLARFGDQLEAAAERSLGSARKRRIARVGLAVAVLSLVAAGTAVGTGLFTPHQVAVGMPAGTFIFGGTHPTCTLDGDGATYHCTLDSAPTGDQDDYRGTKEVVAIDQKVAGGCIGQDQAGLAWDCWIGMDAVRHEIITQDFLGEPVLGPGQG
jgi:hypothetical protein